MTFLCACGESYPVQVGKDGSIRIVCERCARALIKDRTTAPCWRPWWQKDFPVLVDR